MTMNTELYLTLSAFSKEECMDPGGDPPKHSFVLLATIYVLTTARRLTRDSSRDPT